MRIEAERLRDELGEARGEAWEARARLDAILAGRRYRLGSALLAPLAPLRRIVARLRGRGREPN